MKKILSLMLSLTIILSAMVIVSTTSEVNTVSAKSKNKTTYPASSLIYDNSYGTVYRNRNKLFFKSNSGKPVVLDKLCDSDEIYANYYFFYLKGKTVYYEKYGDSFIYSISITGKNKKKIAKNAEMILGGYGSDIVTYKNRKLYKINTNGKKTKLIKIPKHNPFKFKNNDIFLSNGKAYAQRDDNKNKWYVYDIAKKKLGTIIAGDKMYHGKNNIYYEYKNRLINIDLSGKRKVIAGNISRVLCCNNGSTVVYTKKDRKGMEVLYRKTGKKAARKLCTYSDIEKATKASIDKAYSVLDEKDSGVVDIGAVVCGNYICIKVTHYAYEECSDMILSVYKNGGKLKCFIDSYCNTMDKLESTNKYISYVLSASGESIGSDVYTRTFKR